MTAQQYTKPEPDPRARLREMLKESPISPEIAELRLAVLRQEMPKLVVQIDSVRADDTAISVKATIGLPNGARHTNIYTADVDPGRSWAEQHDEAQAIAIARALDGLGISAEPSAGERQTPPQPEQRRQPPESPAKPATAPRSDDDHLSEYSWTSFWQAAHARNITREQVEQALGRSIQESTPKDAVDALVATGNW